MEKYYKENEEEETQLTFVDIPKAYDIVAVIGCLNGIPLCNKITKGNTFNIYKPMIKSNRLYEATIWRINDRYKKKLDTVEMDATRRSKTINDNSATKN